jgi:3-deoxy-D-manno-octulosonic-acid transferase
MSPRSFRFYSLLRLLFAPTFAKFALIFAQSEREAMRYKSMAGRAVPILIPGNLKYDNLNCINPITSFSKDLASKTGVSHDDLVLVAGSTHEQEEQVVLQVLDRLNKINPSIPYRLIIAPRHPERFARVCEIIKTFERVPKRFSQSEAIEAKTDVLVLDSIGELAHFYSLATVAFVGGTIADVGGHNLVEPYAFGVPVVCGPSLFKTQETATTLSQRGGLLIGKSAEEVEELLIQILMDEKLRKQVGDAGQSWLLANQGAVQRTIISVEEIMKDYDLIGSKVDNDVDLKNRFTTQRLSS